MVITVVMAGLYYRNTSAILLTYSFTIISGMVRTELKQRLRVQSMLLMKILTSATRFNRKSPNARASSHIHAPSNVQQTVPLTKCLVNQ